MIEGWGGGAGGSDKGGGGGGAYVCGWYTVAEGNQFTFYIGRGGNGGLNTGQAQHGDQTTITTPNEVIVAW
ncbi:glycine-rich domain-containing protein, partial [Rhizobium leguminosarum]